MSCESDKLKRTEPEVAAMSDIRTVISKISPDEDKSTDKGADEIWLLESRTSRRKSEASTETTGSLNSRRQPKSKLLNGFNVDKETGVGDVRDEEIIYGTERSITG